MEPIAQTTKRTVEGTNIANIVDVLLTPAVTPDADLVTQAHAARILSVSRQRVGQLIQRGELTTTLSPWYRGPLLNRSQIDHYVACRAIRRARRVTKSARGTISPVVEINHLTSSGKVFRRSDLISTSAAAELVGVSTRKVRDRCERGFYLSALYYRPTTHPVGGWRRWGRWFVSREEVLQKDAQLK